MVIIIDKYFFKSYRDLIKYKLPIQLLLLEYIKNNCKPFGKQVFNPKTLNEYIIVNNQKFYIHNI